MFDATPLRSPTRHSSVGLIRITPPHAGPEYHILPTTPEALWSDLANLGPIIMQIRHRYARLITCAPLPTWAEVNAAEAWPLALRPQVWGPVLLRPCPCSRCQCLPSVSAYDQRGAECLQLCAPPNLALDRWRTLYPHFKISTDPTLRIDDSGGVFLPPLPSLLAPRLESEALPQLLAFVAANGEPLRITLRTPAAALTCLIKPERIFAEQHVLTVGDTSSTLQVALPGLRALAPSLDTPGVSPCVHLVGPADTTLLTLSPAADRPAARRWRGFFDQFTA
jgi:hypothetical protein